MPDYQKGKIYKLVSDHTDQIYIGSTIQKLSQRLTKHVSDFRKGRKTPCNSKKLFELGNVKIILIENVPCDSKEELLKHERHYIETTNCVNKYIPGRTDAEYYHDNKEELLKQKKEYYHDNKEEILKKQREYRLKNKEDISKKIKEWHIKNKDKLKEYKKEYRIKNKDKIKERKKLRTICDCGLDVNKHSISRHKKTKNHMDIIKSKMEVPIDATPL